MKLSIEEKNEVKRIIFICTHSARAQFTMGMSPNSESQHPQCLWSASSSCIHTANIIYTSWVIPMLWGPWIISSGACTNLQGGQTEKSVWRQVPGCALLETCSSHPLGIYMLINKYCNIQYSKPHSDFSVQSRLIPQTSMNLFWYI